MRIKQNINNKNKKAEAIEEQQQQLVGWMIQQQTLSQWGKKHTQPEIVDQLTNYLCKPTTTTTLE